MAVVHRFNTDRSIPLFLISLKAGGTGLNLTGADMVIHYDPWWNPAVEDQATDRAYRIGQKRTVYSVKLIAEGTIEQKVLELQKKKRALIDATIESDEDVARSLSWEDVQELLEA
jgi:SNF2 family DNA or RNA helicase